MVSCAQTNILREGPGGLPVQIRRVPKGPEGIGRFPKVQEGSGRLGRVRNRSERIREALGGTGKDGRVSNKKAEASGMKGVQGPGAQGPG
jgi:hypothetical protein